MKKLKDFPQFTIVKAQSINDKFEFSGFFNQTESVLETRCWLVKGGEAFIGDLIDFNSDKKTAKFIYYWAEGSEKIRQNETLAWMNASWNWDFYSAILDEKADWKQEVFQVKDAQVFYLPDGTKGWREVGQKATWENEKIGEVIKDGWDHEGCEICYKHIGKGGDFECYKYKWFWLCVSCFNKYASNHDLSFTDGI